jgi:hypothetical protein
VKLGAQQAGEPGRCAALYPAMQFVATSDLTFVNAAIKVSRNSGLHLK